ncbi:hypothetical protein LIER_11497 [Lithospermum erythrorhizon]|uniref:Uncharacterized protein n=1 Tax=Lithospermum erythrorhizon TaxID=34254 RepID=A0AAV3PSK2_LITER
MVGVMKVQEEGSVVGLGLMGCCCMWKDNMDILVASGFHGGPRTINGGPSSLIKRSRSDSTNTSSASSPSHYSQVLDELVSKTVPHGDDMRAQSSIEGIVYALLGFGGFSRFALKSDIGSEMTVKILVSHDSSSSPNSVMTRLMGC